MSIGRIGKLTRSLLKDKAPNAFKEVGAMGVLGLGMNMGFAAMDYNHARQNGSGVASSAAYAAGTFAMGEILGFGMIPFQLAKSVPTLAVQGVEGLGKLQRQMDWQARPLPFNNSNFVDTQQAYTMRQHGMNLAQQSRYNLQQSIMGNEAGYLR